MTVATGRINWRWTELWLLLPVSVLVTLGLVITNIAFRGRFETGDLTLAVI